MAYMPDDLSDVYHSQQITAVDGCLDAKNMIPGHLHSGNVGFLPTNTCFQINQIHNLSSYRKQQETITTK